MRTEILYEDKHIIVARKPAGLATQTAKVAQADMVSELKNYLKDPYLGIVHRLDQPVEGVLIFGKTKAAAAALSGQLTQGLLNKRYYAVICGKPAESEGVLTDCLRKTSDNRAEIVAADAAPEIARAAKKAVLRYQILESRDTFSLADIRIETGRFHQIRAQMAHAGMPLLGDGKYGSEDSGRLSADLHVKNVALCACDLEFIHPVTQESMCFHVAPQAEIFQQFTIWNSL